MASLDAVREQWEGGGDVLFELEDEQIPGYVVHNVIVRFPSSRGWPSYRLNRYFQLGGVWQVSVDVDSHYLTDIQLYLANKYPKQAFQIKQAAYATSGPAASVRVQSYQKRRG